MKLNIWSRLPAVGDRSHRKKWESLFFPSFGLLLVKKLTVVCFSGRLRQPRGGQIGVIFRQTHPVSLIWSDLDCMMAKSCLAHTAVEEDTGGKLNHKSELRRFLGISSQGRSLSPGWGDVFISWYKLKHKMHLIWTDFTTSHNTFSSNMHPEILINHVHVSRSSPICINCPFNVTASFNFSTLTLFSAQFNCYCLDSKMKQLLIKENSLFRGGNKLSVKSDL